MKELVAIAVGGAAGSLLRYGMSAGVHLILGRGFPWGTLFVNVFGSLLMGLLFVILLERSLAAAEWRAAILVGLLGAFTTFSTFSMETIRLFESGEPLRALLNVLLSVVLCLAATWVGLLIARQL